MAIIRAYDGNILIYLIHSQVWQDNLASFHSNRRYLSETFKFSCIYCKPPNISPGLILVRTPFFDGLIHGGAYIWGGGGLYTNKIWCYRERKEI